MVFIKNNFFLLKCQLLDISNNQCIDFDEKLKNNIKMYKNDPERYKIIIKCVFENLQYEFANKYIVLLMRDQ